LAVPAAIMLSLLGVAPLLYPRPPDPPPRTRARHTPGPPQAVLTHLPPRALVAAGFADFPIIAYHFQHAGTMSASLIPVFYAVAMAASGAGSLVFGRLYDRFGVALLVPLTLVAAGYAPLALLGGRW